MSAIELSNVRGEPVADTRMLAGNLGLQHASIFKMVSDYRTDFEQLGILRFQIGEIKGRGQPEKLALLNEDQTYLLLTFSRNTVKVRQLKVNLVKAFKQARLGRKYSTAIDRLPMQHKVLDISVDRRVSPSVVQGNVNRYMGVKRSRYATVQQVGDGIGFCDRLQAREETPSDFQRIEINHAKLHGESRQLPLLNMVTA